MSIVFSEMIWRKSEVSDDTTSNGGRMISTNTAIADDVKNNLWPDVSQAERDAGSEKWRKAHCHIANDSDLQLLQTRVFIETFTPGADAVTIFLGTSTDTRANLSGTEQNYGCGDLNGDVLAAVETLEVFTEDADLAYFKNNMLVRISDKTDVNDAGNNEEFVRLTADATYVGEVATLIFTGNPLANGYTAATTRVASVIEVGTVEATHTTVVYTPAGAGDGVHDDQYLTMDSIGGVEQEWTLSFTDDVGNFDVIGGTLGTVGVGTTGSGATPTNTEFSKPYFTIVSAFFVSGSFLNNDTLVFTTSPAAIPIWQKRTIPLGAASLSDNKVIIAVDGESA